MKDSQQESGRKRGEIRVTHNNEMQTQNVKLMNQPKERWGGGD